MKTIFFRELSKNRTSYYIYCTVMVLFVWIYVGLFPSFQDQSESYEALLNTMPEALRQAFGVDQLGFNSLESFMSMELMSFMWPILAILLATSRAGNAVAGEIELRTIGLSISLPISRTSILFSKLLSSVLILISFVFVTFFSTYLLAQIYSVPISISNLLAISILAILFVVSFFAIAICISCFVSEKGKVFFIVGSYAILSYATTIISSLNDSIEWLKYGSIFYYFDFYSAFTESSIALTNILVFSVLIICSIAISFYQFNNRDISI